MLKKYKVFPCQMHKYHLSVFVSGRLLIQYLGEIVDVIELLCISSSVALVSLHCLFFFMFWFIQIEVNNNLSDA